MGINIDKIRTFVDKVQTFAYMRLWKYPIAEKHQNCLVNEIAGRGHVNVVIFAMSVAMWRYQHLYEVMKRDRRFTVNVVISPAKDYEYKQKLEDVTKLRNYFKNHNVDFVDFDIEGNTEPIDIRSQFNPDIIFYPQPYEHLLCKEHDCVNFYDLLLCYYPYAFLTGKGKLSYDFHFHNLAWRLYNPLQAHLDEARKTAWNKGRNIRIVGYPNADDYMKPSFTDVWKPINDGKTRKRIIWAPHFTIAESFGQIPRANFLWVASFMTELAREYKDEIQIALKPHPRLLTELYRHPDWGKTKANEFYELWANMENTQLETGDFVDLFMTSDAMIHDSGSFTVEYHYSLKPVMFISRDINYFKQGQTEQSCKSIDAHYIGSNEDEIKQFVKEVVLGGCDPMYSIRERFKNDYLLPPNGKTVAENTMDDLIKSLSL